MKGRSPIRRRQEKTVLAIIARAQDVAALTGLIAVAVVTLTAVS
jgi:hypothetical protein